MYRPPPRSRSPSPAYRQRRYSPSRPRSPSPPRRYDARDDPRTGSRYDNYPPPPRRYSPPPPRRRYSPSPPPTMHREEYEYGRHEDVPPPRRYDDYPPRRSPPPRYERQYETVGGSRSPVPPPRQRDWDRVEPEPRGRGMTSDQAGYNPSRPTQSQGGQWERGVSIEEEPISAGYEEYNRAGPTGKQPSQPTKDVIFLHLDPELTEHELMGYLLEEHRADVESVKIVFDKHTGRSKCFAFANFASVEAAEDFVNHNFPHILMPALHAHSEPRKVKVDFSQPSGESYGVVHVRPGSDGMRDIGSAGGGNRVLLLRGLNFHSSGDDLIRRLGQEIARMVGKQGREKEAESSIVRVALVVDRETRSKWGFAFVELATTELAAALLQHLMSPQSQPHGFVIAEFAVATSFTNLSSFIPVPAGPLGSEFLLRASRNGGIGSETIAIADGQWVGYWHEQSGCLETVPKNALQIGEDGTLQPITIDLRAFLGGLAGPMPGQSSVPVVTTQESAPQPIAPIKFSMMEATIMQPIKLDGKGKKADEGFVNPMRKNLLGDDDDPLEDKGKDSVLLSRTKGIANIIAPSSRKIAKDISKWNTKKTELKAAEPSSSGSSAKMNRPPGLSDANATMGPRQPKPSTSRPASPTSFDFGDTTTLASTGKVACLLCQRQFKSQDLLKKHTDLSELHKTNLADEKIRGEGMKRKNAALAKSAPSPAEAWGQGSGTVYRDRAAERRTVHHQPDRPASSDLEPTNPLKRKYDGPKAPSPPPPVVNPGEDQGNMGNQLLAKMGWKAGTGLGLGGDGRVAPVEVKQFDSRVGLGKAQGRDPASWDGPSGFKTRAYDMARERFNMSDKGQ